MCFLDFLKIWPLFRLIKNNLIWMNVKIQFLKFSFKCTIRNIWCQCLCDLEVLDSIVFFFGFAILPFTHFKKVFLNFVSDHFYLVLWILLVYWALLVIIIGGRKNRWFLIYWRMLVIVKVSKMESSSK